MRATPPEHDHRRELGRRGEALAADFLTGFRGMTILDRNWRCHLGELDLVAKDGSTVVFCEVKTRSDMGFGGPVEAVSVTKQLRLRRLAGAWLAEHDIGADLVRVDVVAILWPHGGRAQLFHLVGVC